MLLKKSISRQVNFEDNTSFKSYGTEDLDRQAEQRVQTEETEEKQEYCCSDEEDHGPRFESDFKANTD